MNEPLSTSTFPSQTSATVGEILEPRERARLSDAAERTSLRNVAMKPIRRVAFRLADARMYAEKVAQR